MRPGTIAAGAEGARGAGMRLCCVIGLKVGGRESTTDIVLREGQEEEKGEIVVGRRKVTN